jgi:hypothetical protein
MVVGDTNSGKSLLINEILCIPKLCHTLERRSACAQVTVSYQYAEDCEGAESNDDKITAWIHFLALGDVKAIVALHENTDKTSMGDFTQSLLSEM